MKTTFLILVISFFSLSLKAQITADKIKTELAGKEWKITKYETFGVESAPTTEQAKDKILLNADMTFVIVENGVEYRGKWSILKPVEYINFKSEKENWSKMYRVISTGETEAVIQFKDVDLIKTDYFLELNK